MGIMTDRQFVLQFYPNAILDYRVRTINTMRSVAHYYIITDNYLKNYETISIGKTRTDAWKNAKKYIQSRM